MMDGSYIGEWLNGVRQGRGVQFNTDGSMYEGWWKNDRYDGPGRLINADGSYQIGMFFEGQIRERGDVIYKKSDTQSINTYEYSPIKIEEVDDFMIPNTNDKYQRSFIKLY